MYKPICQYFSFTDLVTFDYLNNISLVNLYWFTDISKKIYLVLLGYVLPYLSLIAHQGYILSLQYASLRYLHSAMEHKCQFTIWPFHIGHSSYQPSEARLVVTRELDEFQVQGDPGRGASRGRGRGGRRTRGGV